MTKLPEQCRTCDKTCLGNCKHYNAREEYFNDPKTLKRIWEIQQEDFTLHAEGEC